MKKTFVKIMMAAAACIALTAGTTKTTHAQNGRFSVGAELGLPLGNFGDGSGLGFGGTLRYELPLGDKLGLTGTVGYISFSGKSFDPGFGLPSIKGESLAMIPVQLGLKYYFMEAQNGFYAMAQIGVHIASVDQSSIDANGNLTTTSKSKTYLSYAPELGYHLANLDFGLRYQLFSQSYDYITYDAMGNPNGTASETQSAGYIGIRVAYVFGEK
ncbi:MAG: outer membrane beta-barrel protein [Bacteroidia bacterium]